MDGSKENQRRVTDFLRKAEKWLRWSNEALAEMNTYAHAGRMDAVDRVFTSLLSHITTVHEALSAAAKIAGFKDWRTALDEVRNNDPALKYVWHARNIENHEALLKWDASMGVTNLMIVDKEKADAVTVPVFGPLPDQAQWRALVMYALDAASPEDAVTKMTRGVALDKERLERAGIRFAYHRTLKLLPFKAKDNKGKTIQVDAPRIHCGREIDHSAHRLIEVSLLFYQIRFRELARQLGHLVSSELRPPPIHRP